MVSIVIPTYNREKVVVNAIMSVLNQSYTDIEVIVVDDGSKDGTAKEIQSIQDQRLHYVYQENAGACVARNHGIALAQGEYIAFHDSDDQWLPNKLEKQMAVFKNYDPDIVFCKLNKKNGNGVVTVEPAHIKQGFMEPVVNLFGIGTQTIIVKRKVLDSIRFDKDLPRFQEFEMLYRASKYFSIYCMDEGLVNYEVGADSISGNPKKLYEACTIILKKHPEMKTDYPEMMEFMAHSLLTGANQLKISGDLEYKKFIHFSNQCSRKPRLLVKSILIQTGLYDLSRKVRKK